MTMVLGRARRPRLLLVPGLVLAALAMTAGSAAAGGPPPPFSVNVTSLDFGTVTIDTPTALSFTLTTAKNKSAVLSLVFSNGEYSVSGGSCQGTYSWQVPAGTSCDIQVTFDPLTAMDWSGSLTITNCSTFVVNTVPVCDRSHGSLTIPYTGAGANP
ncbi:MAG TPA: hypothetical protein VKR30_01815 [Candidatus Limnocylindrales bacterium]|nr:hypothetical protein [Candidatus Limnocylindrales bacterium]